MYKYYIISEVSDAFSRWSSMRETPILLFFALKWYILKYNTSNHILHQWPVTHQPLCMRLPSLHTQTGEWMCVCTCVCCVLLAQCQRAVAGCLAKGSCWKNNRGVAGLSARWDLLRLGRCVVHCSRRVTTHIKLSQTHLHKHGLYMWLYLPAVS